MHRFLSRRDFVTGSAMSALAVLGNRAFAVSSATTASARTAQGVLLGEQKDGIRIFRGVPFAEPPLGALRFLPPKSPQPWKGTRDATRFPAASVQPHETSIAQSEDCLYLNIWAPAEAGVYPVFVWIHGGGFTGGHAFAPIFDGAEFASAGMVVVTVAYRLGVLGFLDLGSLLGPPYAGTANNALRDLIASLTWIKENIHAFGGDPSRVTVGGESAGAKLTDILMGTPEAAPLFHQMISESGGAERIWPTSDSAAVAEGFGELWAKERGENALGLKDAPAKALIDVQEKFTASWPQHFPLRCEVDGKLLPRRPLETIRSGNTKGKRLLIGTNRDESALFIGPRPQKDAGGNDLGNMSVAAFAKVFARYKTLYPDMSEEQRRIRALSAEEYWVPSVRVADAHSSAGGKSWMYRLDFAPTSGHFAGKAFHSLDIGLVWNKPDKSFANFDQESYLAKQVHAAWICFIRGEAPAASGLPAWPEYSASVRSTMILDAESKIEQKPQEAELQLWKDVL